MNLYSGHSSKQYDPFIDCKNNYSTSTLCFCCLAENVSVLNIRKCVHKEFIKHYLTMEIPELYICGPCHFMLKKIEAFRQQIYMNYCNLLIGLSKDMKQDYRLNVTPLTKTGVNILSDIKSKSDINPLEVVFAKSEECHKIDVSLIKNEVDTEFDSDLPSHCIPSPSSTIDNSTTTTENIDLNHKQEKKHRKEKMPIVVLPKLKDVVKNRRLKNLFVEIDLKTVDKSVNHNIKQENLPTEKLENKYLGKIEMLNLSMEEMLKERSEKSLVEPYSKMEFKCELCIKGFLHKDSYDAHMKTRHELKPGLISCEICKSVFKDKSAYHTHYKRHFKRYVCLVCYKKQSDLDSTAEHYNVTHPEREPIKMVLECKKCDFVTSSSRKYRYHMDIHRGGTICDKCNKRFCTQRTYASHLRICNQKSTKTYKCDRCPKTYKCRSGLYAHQKIDCTSTPVKKGYCATCNIYFKTEANYESHMKTAAAHATEDAYKLMCDLCKKKFKSKSSLETHMIREHLKIKNFKCTFCEKTLYTKRILKNHVNYVHLKLRRPKDKICDFCGKAFNSIQILNNHIRIHTGERPLKCPFCDASFGHGAALYTHKKLVHKVPPKNAT